MATPHTTPQRTTELRLARARWRADEAVPLLQDVIAFARVAYTGLTDAAGHPAIEHPLRIMDTVSSDDARIVAVLHDTLLHEAIVHNGSCSPTLARDLRALVSDRLMMAIAAFSHSGDGIDGISAELIAGDPLALEVELACLADLTDPARMAELDPFSRRRLEASCSASARALGTTLPEVQADQWIAKRNAVRAQRAADDTDGDRGMAPPRTGASRVWSFTRSR
jgi:hypothetical protein